jgi:hypothetical protein
LDDVALGTGLRVRAGVRRPMVPPVRLELTIPRRALALQASARPPAHRRQIRVSRPAQWRRVAHRRSRRNSVGKVARAEGLEPPPGGFGDRCSRPLSYTGWLREKESNLRTPVSETGVSISRNYPASLRYSRKDRTPPLRQVVHPSEQRRPGGHRVFRGSGTVARQARQGRANDVEGHRLVILYAVLFVPIRHEGLR